MDYEKMLAFRQLQVENEDVLDFAETNLYNYFKSKFPIITDPSKEVVMNKSELIEDWLNLFNIDLSFKDVVVINKGFENSLCSLMKVFNDKSWYLPSSSLYDLPKKADDIISSKVAYYENLTFTNIFRNIPTGTEIILCSSTVVPYGRKLQTAEYYTLKQWLKEDNQRRVIFDCSYLYTVEENEEIFKLFRESDQVYFIFSFANSWIIPDNVGVSFIPEQDKLLMDNIFDNDIHHDDLLLAYTALKDYAYRPQEVREALLENINNTTRMITDFGFIFDIKNPSFLFYSSKSLDYWKEQGYLVIDAKDLGGKSGTVISILN